MIGHGVLSRICARTFFVSARKLSWQIVTLASLDVPDPLDTPETSLLRRWIAENAWDLPDW